MPDVFDANGLQVQTAEEITANLVSGLRGIYGDDIQTDQNSPDGQMIGILTQMAVDLRELLVSINTSFDPDQAVGKLLDQRCAINNVDRQGGTYTVIPVDIVVSQTVTLTGLDASFNDPNGTGYTVQDGSGNQFILVDTTTLTGNETLSFRAKKIGDVEVPINTVVNPVTIVPGVVSVNNSSAAISVGTVEELDPQLRTKRAQSVANGSAGYLNGLLGAVLGLSGVTDGVLYENDTDSVDGNGIPAHGIWLVVEGGANSDIANQIYLRKSYGANQKGAVSVDITTASGGLFVAKFDRPTARNLYLRFNLKRTVTGYVFDDTAIKTYIADNLTYRIGAFAETSTATAEAVQGIASQGGGGVPLDLEISSDGSTWTDYLAVPTLDSQWTLDPSRISITEV